MIKGTILLGGHQRSAGVDSDGHHVFVSITYIWLVGAYGREYCRTELWQKQVATG